MSAMPVRTPRRRLADANAVSSKSRPTLHVVKAPTQPRRSRGVILSAFALVLGSLLGALALNTMMATTAYEIADQQSSLARLVEYEQALAYEVRILGSATHISDEAQRMGMIPAEGMNYLNLQSQLIIGPDTPDQD